MAHRLQPAEFVGHPSPPLVGEEAAGHGMARRIAAVPRLQPLASDNIWRVVLENEAVVRVVGRSEPMSGRRWALLAMSDMSDEQLDTYEAAIAEGQEPSSGRGPALEF